MILLDHNIPEQQAEILRRARLQPRQIGREVGRPEWQDLEEILHYLHHLKAATFITRDEGFFRRRLCHSNYCNDPRRSHQTNFAARLRKICGTSLLSKLAWFQTSNPSDCVGRLNRPHGMGGKGT